MTRGTGANAESLRRQLEGMSGRRFWRGLDELANTEDFRAFLEAEFPAAAKIADDVSRRTFLRVMGASMMLAGLSGCGQSPVDGVPYVRQPEFTIPGVPKYYATAVTFEGYAQPVIGETHEGRPTKLEGNPDHPASWGVTDAFTQAAVLQLYDPDRSQVPTQFGRPVSWADVESSVISLRARLASDKSRGFRLLTGAVTSPTLARQIDSLVKSLPNARWHSFEPVGNGLRPEAIRRAVGGPHDLRLMLENAECVVSLDDDFLGPGPRQVANAHGWAQRRLAAQEKKGKSLLFMAENVPSNTGAVATRYVPASPVQIAQLAFAIASGLGIGVPAPDEEMDEQLRGWANEAVKSLRANRGRSLVTVGMYQPAELQALGWSINERLGNIGKTLVFTKPIVSDPPDGERSLEALTKDMAAGEVDTLVVLGANPIHAAPRGLGFAAAWERVPTRVHAGLYYDETAAESHWHLPLCHELESWSDARAVDGTATLMQPLVRPFYDVRSSHEIMALLGGRIGGIGREIVLQTWQSVWPEKGEAFEEHWRKALHDGFVTDTQFAPVEVLLSVRPDQMSVPRTTDKSAVDVVLRPDPTVWDGRFANLGWLQELPKPLTKLTWDNIVAVSATLAKELKVENGDVVEIKADGAAITGPVWVFPRQPERTIAVFLGYGRARSGRIGNGIGYDAYPLLRASNAFHVLGAALRATGERLKLAHTQYHGTMTGGDFVRVVPRVHADEPVETAPPLDTLYEIWPRSDPSWGMTIDLDMCIGCNACIVACYAENNIAVVGKDQVAMGREMQWLRVDRYYSGEPENPDVHFQPVPCMHCEHAPCEMGCPVGATVHGPDGINEMIYNRCIGTRTCSTFCPYKVRRFNWFDYNVSLPPSLQARENPNVTVRSLGVMEKCTYCVQRVNAARIQAQKEQRPIRDGEVVTACQAVCPTHVIVFGNIEHPDSAVSKKKADPRNYTLLRELNTRPRTTYLAKIDDTAEEEGGS